MLKPTPKRPKKFSPAKKMLSVSWLWGGRWLHRDVDSFDELPRSYKRSRFTVAGLNYAVTRSAMDRELKRMKRGK